MAAMRRPRRVRARVLKIVEQAPIDTASTRGAGKLFLPALVGVLLLAAALGSSKSIFNDGDVSWHIATGQWILQHGAIPRTDPFSFTWAGKPWVPIEWLAGGVYARGCGAPGLGGGGGGRPG